MKATKRLIKAVAAFGASVVLCVGACAAWFIVNSSVGAENMNTQVANGGIISFTLKAYALGVNEEESSDTNGTVYTVGEEYTAGKMKTYGDFEGGITALLLEIDCEIIDNNTTAYRVYVKGSDTIQNVSVHEDAPDDDDDYDFECNLSDAVCFYGVTYAGTTVTTGDNITFGTARSMISYEGLEVSKSEVVIDAAVTANKKLYVVIDYDTININALYSNALSLGGTLNSTMKFINDIDFVIEKGAS